MDLSTQHCLAIAAAFISLIAACATLISSANAKHDALATRIREASKELREGKITPQRCDILREQLGCFQIRFAKNQWTQRFLYSTIGLFIIALGIFMSEGLYIIHNNISDKQIHIIARTPIEVIAALVTGGAISMLAAVLLQIMEVGESSHTLDIEIEDCISLREAIVVSATPALKSKS